MSLRDSHSAAGRTLRGGAPGIEGKGWLEESQSRSDMSYGRRCGGRGTEDGHVGNVPHRERLHHDRVHSSGFALLVKRLTPPIEAIPTNSARNNRFREIWHVLH